MSGATTMAPNVTYPRTTAQ